MKKLFFGCMLCLALSSLRPDDVSNQVAVSLEKQWQFINDKLIVVPTRVSVGLIAMFVSAGYLGNRGGGLVYDAFTKKTKHSSILEAVRSFKAEDSPWYAARIGGALSSACIIDSISDTALHAWYLKNFLLDWPTKNRLKTPRELHLFFDKAHEQMCNQGASYFIFNTRMVINTVRQAVILHAQGALPDDYPCGTNQFIENKLFVAPQEAQVFGLPIAWGSMIAGGLLGEKVAENGLLRYAGMIVGGVIGWKLARWVNMRILYAWYLGSFLTEWQANRDDAPEWVQSIFDKEYEKLKTGKFWYLLKNSGRVIKDLEGTL
jgi:hypothetical protein